MICYSKHYENYNCCGVIPGKPLICTLELLTNSRLMMGQDAVGLLRMFQLTWRLPVYGNPPGAPVGGIPKTLPRRSPVIWWKALGRPKCRSFRTHILMRWLESLEQSQPPSFGLKAPPPAPGFQVLGHSNFSRRKQDWKKTRNENAVTPSAITRMWLQMCVNDAKKAVTTAFNWLRPPTQGVYK